MTSIQWHSDPPVLGKIEASKTRPLAVLDPLPHEKLEPRALYSLFGLARTPQRVVELEAYCRDDISGEYRIWQTSEEFREASDEAGVRIENRGYPRRVQEAQGVSGQ